MMEYIFFDAGLRDRFVQFSQDLGVACELQEDNMGMVVAVADELDDELMDTLENHYEALQDEQSQMMSQSEGGFKSLAGFSVVLPDGTIGMVPLQPEMANRLLASFSIEEIQLLFSAVARVALDPQEKPLCQILRASNDVCA